MEELSKEVSHILGRYVDLKKSDYLELIEEIGMLDTRSLSIEEIRNTDVVMSELRSRYLRAFWNT